MDLITIVYILGTFLFLYVVCFFFKIKTGIAVISLLETNIEQIAHLLNYIYQDFRKNEIPFDQLIYSEKEQSSSLACTIIREYLETPYKRVSGFDLRMLEDNQASMKKAGIRLIGLKMLPIVEGMNPKYYVLANLWQTPHGKILMYSVQGFDYFVIAARSLNDATPDHYMSLVRCRNGKPMFHLGFPGLFSEEVEAEMQKERESSFLTN